MKSAIASRSSYGDGTVYQRKDGRWAAKMVPYPGAKVKYLYGKTRAEVVRKLRAYKSSDEVMLYSTPSNVTLVEYMKHWLRLYKKTAVKQGTYDRLESVFRNHIVPAFEYRMLCDITADELQIFILNLSNASTSRATVKKAYELLSNCISHAVSKGDLDTNLMSPVVLPSADKFAVKDDRALSPEESERLFSELFQEFSNGRPKYSYRDAFVVMLNTGLREGEMVALDWADINVKRREMYVRKTAIIVKDRDINGELAGGCHQEIQATPKTKKGNRTIPLNKSALGALSKLREASKHGVSVLETSAGTRPMVTALQKQIKRAASRCGLHNVSPHTLRHTFASNLLRRGADVKSVSSLLGHSSITVTLNIYYHLMENQCGEAVSLLDEE